MSNPWPVIINTFQGFITSLADIWGWLNTGFRIGSLNLTPLGIISTGLAAVLGVVFLAHIISLAIPS